MESADYFLTTIVALILGGFIIIVILLLVIPSGPWNDKCSTNNECLNTEVCSDGKCKLVISQPCNSNSECDSGLCLDGVCSINSNIDSIPIRFRRPQITPPTNVVYPPFSVDECVYDLRSPDIDYIDESDNTHTPQLLSYYTDEEQSDYRFDIGPPAICEPFEKSEGGSHYPTAEDSGIIDVINYSDSIVYLYSDGRVRKNETFVTTNVRFSSFVMYDGYLVGLSKGKLYKLSTESYESDEWIFKPYDIYNEDEIMRIKSTLDGNYISIQTSNKLIVYGTSGSRDIIEYNVSNKRIYGYSVDKYIDVDILKKRGVDYRGEIYENIVDAVVDYDGNVKTLTVEFALKNGYASLRIVNWEPYYLKNI